MEEASLISRIKDSDCEDSLKTLIARHEGLIKHMSQKYAASDGSPRNVSLRQEEVWDNRFLLVYEAAKNFDHTRNVKFSTYLGSQVRYHCLNHIKKEGKYITCESKALSYLMETNAVEERGDHTLEVSYILNLLQQSSDDRLKSIIRMRYFSGDSKATPFSRIARRLNMSAQGVIDIHDRFLSLVRKKMKSPKISDVI